MATKTRKTIGQNPLDAVVPDLRLLNQTNAQTPSTTNSDTPEPDLNRKERLTIHLPLGLIERLKNAVYWTPGLTLADLGETALGQWIDEIETQRGAPFEPRAAQLKGGRPLKRP